MSNKFILPNFEACFSQYIDESIKKLKKSPLYNSNYNPIPSNKRYEEALNELILSDVNSKLTNRNIKILSYYLIDLESKGLFSEYYNIFKKIFQLEKI